MNTITLIWRTIFRIPTFPHRRHHHKPGQRGISPDPSNEERLSGGTRGGLGEGSALHAARFGRLWTFGNSTNDDCHLSPFEPKRASSGLPTTPCGSLVCTQRTTSVPHQCACICFPRMDATRPCGLRTYLSWGPWWLKGGMGAAWHMEDEFLSPWHSRSRLAERSRMAGRCQVPWLGRLAVLCSRWEAILISFI